MKTAGVLLYFLMLFTLGENYRILGIFQLPNKSHTGMYLRLMRLLAEKGHEVDVVSHFPLKEPIPRYNDISLEGSLPILCNNVKLSFVQEKIGGTILNTMQFITNEVGFQPCKVAFNTIAMQELKKTSKKYDLIITELFGSDCMLGFAHHFNVPHIGITSSVNLPWGADRIGNPDNPSYIPIYFLPYLSRMSLMEKVINTVNLLFTKIYYSSTVESSNEIAREFFGQDLPDLRDLAYNTSLLLINSHFSISHARPTVPNFIEIAGLHIEPGKPLPKHLNDSLNISNKYKGVIYLSFGSMILTESLPVEKLRSFFEAFKELPYKILWKAARENIPEELNIPSNIQFQSWLPQLEVLCHPNVKLFVSHGGLMGTQESTYCGVPILGIPFYADQMLNLKGIEEKKFAIIVNYEDITKQRILETAETLLGNPMYKNNAESISKLFKDRPLSPMDTAVYWVEYVIRHKGAPHLRSVGADLPWYQYFLVDVAGVLLMFLLSAVFLIYFLISFVLKIVLPRGQSSSKKKKN